MSVYKTEDVFTPSKPASLSFVDRKGVEKQLERALRTPGKQIVVYGHSGSGKTTLIINTLRKYALCAVTCRCTKESTFASIILTAFDKLDPYYASERTKSQESTVSVKLQADYQLVKSSLETTLKAASTDKCVRALPPQLTAERLAEFCGAAGCCLVLEDFHKVPKSEKEKVAQSMKVFMDTAAEYPSVKVVAIGAVDTARNVVECDPEMRTRIAEIPVPLLSESELKSILKKGEDLLKVRFGSLRDQIANYSSGLGAVCHQLALNICFSAGVYQTCESDLWVSSEKLQSALQQYVEDSSDTMKAAFDKAMKNKRKRKFDNTNLILKAITAAGTAGATHANLLRVIQKDQPTYPAGNLTTYLAELESEERGEILRHDPILGKYYFNDPLSLVYAQCLYVPAKGSKTLSIKLLGFEFKIDPDEIKAFRRS